jgi:hypothetical protein
MSPELDKKLCEKYPKIFVKRNASPSSTAMCWGFQCGDGWYDIIDYLCEKLQELSDRTGEQVVASQVKEKFGTLRFYVESETREAFDLIRQAEEDSEITCEVCGQPGTWRTTPSGWWRVTCEEHSKEELSFANL